MHRPPSIQRRTWMLLSATLLAGCSATKKKSPRSKAAKRPKGPKTMANLLIDSYIADLKQGPADKQVAAAKELAAMGSKAKAALPALKPLTANTNPKVSAAAKEAIQAIQ